MEVTMAQSNPAPSESADADQPSGKKPVDKFHDGPVPVSIWENEGAKGAFRTASFQLRYRDQHQKWQTSHSYSASDLKHLETAAVEARARIERWQQTSPRPASPK
jgi:hypothetical protein